MEEERAMAKCETCGNNYENTFQVMFDGTSYDFDCFECAIHALAPICRHCGVRILGHGVQYEKRIFCCVHCASAAGFPGLTDHAEGVIAA